MKFQKPRDVVSPREGRPHGVPPPTRPGDDGFDDMLAAVVDTVDATEKGKWSFEFIADGNPTELGGTVPSLLARKLNLGNDRRPKPKNLALAVSMDSPWHLGEFLFEALKKRGAKLKIQKEGTIQFCDSDSSYIQYHKDLMNAISKSLELAFDAKYEYRQPRPEDYLEIPGGIFTVDGYGAPQHFSYVAGHAAYSGATAAVIMQSFDLDDELRSDVLHAAWTFGHGRSFLGVHFHEDNAEGFKLGLKAVD